LTAKANALRFSAGGQGVALEPGGVALDTESGAVKSEIDEKEKKLKMKAQDLQIDFGSLGQSGAGQIAAKIGNADAYGSNSSGGVGASSESQSAKQSAFKKRLTEAKKSIEEHNKLVDKLDKLAEKDKMIGLQRKDFLNEVQSIGRMSGNSSSGEGLSANAMTPDNPILKKMNGDENMSEKQEGLASRVPASIGQDQSSRGNYNFQLEEDGQSNRENLNAGHGLSSDKEDALVRDAQNEVKRNTASERDTLFDRVTKTYFRAGFPKLLKKKN